MTDDPRIPGESESPGFERFRDPADYLPVRPPPPVRKFQHRYRRHIILFVLTLATTTFAGVLNQSQVGADDVRAALALDPWAIWTVVSAGFWYSLPLLTILGAHEFGHYFACRWHNVDATLPYFLPAPLPLTGTVGAVIRIREAFPSKKALFDIGVAGPIAGFVALLPFLYWGIGHSELRAAGGDAASIYLGEPLLYQWMERLRFGPLPEGVEVFLHPTAFAAWWGMLATALNLMPFGQLDGGHIIYSILGRRASFVSLATVGVAVLLTLQSMSWLSVTIMMLIMAVFLGVGHPRIRDEDTPLDPRRQLVALFALLMFVVCFTPVPIEVFTP